MGRAVLGSGLAMSCERVGEGGSKFLARMDRQRPVRMCAGDGRRSGARTQAGVSFFGGGFCQPLQLPSWMRDSVVRLGCIPTCKVDAGK